MDNSIYITLSRQASMFRDLDVAANNIANANTTGYNAQKLMFSQYLVEDNGNRDAYANDAITWRDTAQGSLTRTNNNFDLAISGSGYFQLQSPLGTRYTRAGNFKISGDGTLVNIDGYPVLGGDGGVITIPDNANEVLINGSGEILVDGENVGDVGVVEFQREQEMKRLGNSLFSSNETPVPSTTARLVQGALESSNVSAISEIVHVMELSRATNNTAQFVEIVYDLQRKSSETFTRQSA